MSADIADTSVRTEITVDVPLERAFRVFTERFDPIKPREPNMLAGDIAHAVFEPRGGGRSSRRRTDRPAAQGGRGQWGRRPRAVGLGGHVRRE